VFMGNSPPLIRAIIRPHVILSYPRFFTPTASRKLSHSSGIAVTRSVSKIPYARGLAALLHKLDTPAWRVFFVGVRYPERYSRWDFAAVAPPIEIVAAGREIYLRPLNARGKQLAKIFEPLLADQSALGEFRDRKMARCMGR